MRVRRLNEDGINKFWEFLDSVESENPLDYPADLLENPETSVEIEPEIEVENESFSNRLEGAKYLFDKLDGSGLVGIEQDKELWAWLSLFFFEKLCVPDKNRQRKPGEKARWILEPTNFRKYYRHLLAAPYRIYAANRDEPEGALIVLCGPLHKPGDMVEQISARQEIITNKGILSAASTLYYDHDTKQLKRGATNRNKTGTVRRFIDLLDQYDLTWDLYSMKSDDLLEMLPSEFSRFLGAESA